MSTTGTTPLRLPAATGQWEREDQSGLNGSWISEDMVDVPLPKETDDAISAALIVTVGEYAPLETYLVH